MTNPTTNQPTTETSEASDALIVEGKALAVEWSKMVKSETSAFNRSIKDGGFDNRLGKLLLTLKGDAEQTPAALLKTHGVNTIDRRRRSEAMWFASNEVEIVAYIKASKQSLSSLSAVQRSMKKASEPKVDPKDKPKATVTDEPSDTLDTETPEVSNEPQSAHDIALNALILADTNGISVNELLSAIRDQLELLDIDIAA